MGAWGEGPTDNDTAADMAIDLEKSTVYEIVEQGLASSDEHEQRFAAWLVSRLGYAFVYKVDKVQAHVELAMKKMTALLANEEWIGTWRDKAEIRKALQEQIDDLSKLST